MNTMDDYPVWFIMLTNNISSNTNPNMVVPFLLVPLHWGENVKIGRGKGSRQQLRHFKHKGKHKIGFYPKSILIFTGYQVKGWLAMIQSTVKAQHDGIYVIEIILNGSWHTQINYSNPYMFILQKWRSLKMYSVLIVYLSQQ